MCEILCLTSHNPAERDAIIQRVWSEMKRSQHDGYGAAWFGANGEIGFYKSRWPVIPTEKKPEFIKPDFQDFNDIESDGGYLIIHGRGASTNIAVALHNTHPMIAPDDTMALVHNGLVWHTKGVYKNLAPCTCDSELLMLAYQAGGIEEVSEHIGGSFAFMALEYKDGQKTLHVAKDDKKTLYGGKMPGGEYIFATTLSLMDVMDAIPMGEPRDHHLMIFGREEEGFELIKFEPYRIATYAADDFDDRGVWYGNQQHRKIPLIIPTLPGPLAQIVTEEEEILRQEREPILT